MVGVLDPLKYPEIPLVNLKELIKSFLYDFNPETNPKGGLFTNERTFVLLGLAKVFFYRKNIIIC